MAVLLVGDGAAGRSSELLDTWQRRARAVEYNHCVIEAGDAAEHVDELSALLQQHVPSGARVVVLQAARDVPEEELERALDALSRTSLARQSMGPLCADDEEAFAVAVFPSEADVLRERLQQLQVEQPEPGAINAGVEAGIEAREHPRWQLQRQQKIGELKALQTRVATQQSAVRELVVQLLHALPQETPAPALPSALLEPLNLLQLKPHWQAAAQQPQAWRLMALLVRLGRQEPDPTSPIQFALRDLVGCLSWDGPALDAMLTALNGLPPESDAVGQLIDLTRAMREHEVASGLCDHEPEDAPRRFARWVMLHDRLQDLVLSAFDSLSRAPERNLQHETDLRHVFHQAQLALLLGEEGALPDASELADPGFDPVAGVVFAAWRQSQQRAADDVDAFMAQWSPWQIMRARLSSQREQTPTHSGSDAD